MKAKAKDWRIPQEHLPAYLRLLAARSRKPQQKMLIHTVIGRVEKGVSV